VREARVAWKKIEWRTCLLGGLDGGCREKKAVFLWVLARGTGRWPPAENSPDPSVRRSFPIPRSPRALNNEFVPIYVSPEQVPSTLPARRRAKMSRLLSNPVPLSGRTAGNVSRYNAGGQALAWAMTGRTHEDILSFLDHAWSVFRKNPDGQKPVTTERYMQYPRQRLKDYKTEAATSPIRRGIRQKRRLPLVDPASDGNDSLPTGRPGR